MNMLAFDPIRAMSHDFLRVFIIPPAVYKKSEAVARLVRGEEINKEKSTIRIKNQISKKLEEEELSQENDYS